MRHFLFGLVGLALIDGAVGNAQTATDVNEGCRMTQDAGMGGYTFSWWGRNARTYFIQHSDDLVTWTYMPIIESGAAAVTDYRFTSTGQRFFLRLRHTDAATGGNPNTADFDGDGLGNAAEIAGMGPHTDPLAFSTDGDYWGDGYELLWGLNPLNGETPVNDGGTLGLTVFSTLE